MAVRRWAPWLGLLLAAALSLAAAGGQGWGYDLADELMSPFCPGRALSECPSPQAADLRRWILEQEQAGATRAQVEEELFRAYGDQLRQAPRARGVGLVAYAIPLVLFLVGGALAARVLSRGRRSPRSGSLPAEAPPDPELERLVDEELGGA